MEVEVPLSPRIHRRPSRRIDRLGVPRPISCRSRLHRLFRIASGDRYSEVEIRRYGEVLCRRPGGPHDNYNIGMGCIIPSGFLLSSEPPLGADVDLNLRGPAELYGDLPAGGDLRIEDDQRLAR